MRCGNRPKRDETGVRIWKFVCHTRPGVSIVIALHDYPGIEQEAAILVLAKRGFVLRDMSIDRGSLNGVVFHLFLVLTSSSVGLAGYAWANISVIRWSEPYRNLRKDDLHKATKRLQVYTGARKRNKQAASVRHRLALPASLYKSAENLKRYGGSYPNRLLLGYFQVCCEGKDRYL